MDHRPGIIHADQEQVFRPAHSDDIRRYAKQQRFKAAFASLPGKMRYGLLQELNMLCGWTQRRTHPFVPCSNVIVPVRFSVGHSIALTSYYNATTRRLRLAH